MKRTVGPIFFVLILLGAIVWIYNKCSVRNIFHLKTQREAYFDKLKKISDSLAMQWDSSARLSLSEPNQVLFPYAEKGTFKGFEATGLQFSTIAGRQINISIINHSAQKIFADLIQIDSVGFNTVVEADTTKNIIQHPAYFGGDFILRLQPVANYSGEYEVKIESQPLLQWPVQEGMNANIGSYWGANRDGGSRQHEGIDIFAPRGTYLLAVADGIVHRTGQNNLGGNIIFMRPDDMPLSVYYAHLDTQLVQQGARVKAGDTIATMGNTGNAISTPPHLHLGIYARPYGAIDPIGFIQKAASAKLPSKNLPQQKIKTGKSIRVWQRLESKASSRNIARTDTLHVLGISGSYYRVQTASGNKGFVLQKDF